MKGEIVFFDLSGRRQREDGLVGFGTKDVFLKYK